jgi:hypothetical protein
MALLAHSWPPLSGGQIDAIPCSIVGFGKEKEKKTAWCTNLAHLTPIRELTHAQYYIYAYSLLINPFDHKVLS